MYRVDSVAKSKMLNGCGVSKYISYQHLSQDSREIFELFHIIIKSVLCSISESQVNNWKNLNAYCYVTLRISECLNVQVLHAVTFALTFSYLLEPIKNNFFFKQKKESNHFSPQFFMLSTSFQIVLSRQNLKNCY